MEVRLVYVRGPFAWFAERPAEAHGDDWDDAPHECNAGEPYPEHGGLLVKVAYDGDLEVGGEQCACYLPSLSVDAINAGAAPWLYRPSYGYKQFPAPLLEIPALVTLSEFEALVRRADGHVYRATPYSAPQETDLSAPLWGAHHPAR